MKTTAWVVFAENVVTNIVVKRLTCVLDSVIDVVTIKAQQYVYRYLHTHA